MGSTLQLGDVEVTAMIPLMNRATETQRKHPRVRDEKAVEIVETLGVKTAKYDKLVTHECVVARTIMFDEALRDLIALYPDATVVNLGCGLDNRFARVDNGRIRWYDLDLPDSIEVRRKVFSDTGRRTMLPVSVLDASVYEKRQAARRHRGGGGPSHVPVTGGKRARFGAPAVFPQRLSSRGAYASENDG